MSNTNNFVPTDEMFQARDGTWRWRAGTIDEVTGKPRNGAPFVRGAPSPNPTGRPKSEQKHQRFLDQAIQELEGRLAEILCNPKAKDADILTAYKLLTERRFGKPNQKTEHKIDGPPEGFKPMVIDSSIAERLIEQEQHAENNSAQDNE